MIRLVHQFDSPRARAAAASPKSENCSCCCSCCVVTALATSVLTARAVGRTPRKRRAADQGVDEGAKAGSPITVPGAAAPANTAGLPPVSATDTAPLSAEAAAAVRDYLGTRSAPSAAIRVMAFLLLPIAVALGFGTELPPVSIAVYVAGLAALVIGRLVSLRSLALLLAVLILGGAAEMFVWVSVILH